MSWIVTKQPNGMVEVANAVGRPLFDLAFRHDIPESLRERVLALIEEAPDRADYPREMTTKA